MLTLQFTRAELEEIREALAEAFVYPDTEDEWESAFNKVTEALAS